MAAGNTLDPNVDEILRGLDPATRGFVLGSLVLARSTAGASAGHGDSSDDHDHDHDQNDGTAALAEPAAGRCRAALAAISVLGREARIRVVTFLAGQVLAPPPEGTLNARPERLREILAAESSQTLLLIAAGAPAALRSAASAVLAARGKDEPVPDRAPARGTTAEAAEELRRSVLARIASVEAGPDR